MKKRFTLDKANGKLMGVCAGFARMTGWDVTLIRVAMVVTALIVHPLVIVYFAAGLIAAKEDPRQRHEEDVPAPPGRWARPATTWSSAASPSTAWPTARRCSRASTT